MEHLHPPCSVTFGNMMLLLTLQMWQSSRLCQALCQFTSVMGEKGLCSFSWHGPPWPLASLELPPHPRTPCATLQPLPFFL